MSVDLQSIFALSSVEKLQLLEDLCNNLASNPETVPVYDWQIEELDRRKADLKANPQPLSSWEDVKARIRARNGH